ncbi:PQQ-dependent sugar dehydrogenase [Aliiglaciecola sp. LCG003]|uniref:PQQ-dependent sugar dehydrogenase n=1 Tax=Aliiglaciecola sp. LCG003 TaxID=3053655 RepID=UPI002572F96B|nr:PQQ-dependent sugar dehydrogenase [Aliiglaciecola sp. LCG003]WJG10175.1 PQQ-dependent sugar dehydrogenase [Aliiglaciecola sp. LCG003]
MLLRKISSLLCVFCVAGGISFDGLSNQTDPFEVEEVVAEIAYPWSMTFISDNQFLVTQRSGFLRHVVNKTVGAPVKGLPDDIYFNGQGGLLDIVLHPDYLENGWIYLSYSAGNDKSNTLKVIRAKLQDNQLVDLQTILVVNPSRDTPVHYGAKMAFLGDNTLLITSGDGFDYREDAQRLNNQMGKILRINDDGSIPVDNPFAGDPKQPLANSVFSVGHRNPQGLVYDANRGLVYSHEHGPAGGDEINVIKPGKNYGWPVITYGRDYSGASISPFTTYPGMEQPLVDWTPSIAPSAMVVYNGQEFPQMRGDLLVTTLKAKELRWVKMSGNKAVEQQSLLTDLGYRLRDIKVHPDGSIYLLTDGGKILRLTAKLD